MQNRKKCQSACEPPYQSVKQAPGDASSKVRRLTFKKHPITDADQPAAQQMNHQTNSRRCTTDESSDIGQAANNSNNRQEHQPAYQSSQRPPTDGSQSA